MPVYGFTPALPALPPPGAHSPVPACDTCAARGLCVFHADEAAFARLAPHLTQARLSPREVLYEQGAMLDHLHVVKLGTVFTCRADFGLDKRPIAVFPRGTILGASAYGGQASLVSAQAATTVRLCSVPIQTMHLRARQSEALARLLATLVARNVAQLMQWTAAIGQPTIIEKVGLGLLLLSEHSGSQRITLPPQHHFAVLLGTTRETVARALRELAAQGCIRQVSRSLWDVTGALQPWLAKRSRQPPWPPRPADPQG